MARSLLPGLWRHSSGWRCKSFLVEDRASYILPAIPRPRYIQQLAGRADKYNGITVDVGQLPVNITDEEFIHVLNNSLNLWTSENRTAVWLYVPIQHGRLMALAAQQGFSFHHAENQHAMMKKWTEKGKPDGTPRFATHQVGVAGVVLRENTRQVLVVQDRHKTYTTWKFPTGLSDLGEDIGDTAVREVYEETGIQTDFKAVIAFRQQHQQPGAFGRSDFFAVCRLSPRTFDIHPCEHEVIGCQWMTLNELEQSADVTSITQRIIQLLELGLIAGFQRIDLRCEKMTSVYKGLDYTLFHRPFEFFDIEKSTAAR